MSRSTRYRRRVEEGQTVNSLSAWFEEKFYSAVWPQLKKVSKQSLKRMGHPSTSDCYTCSVDTVRYMDRLDRTIAK